MKKVFVIQSPRQRIWELLMKAILRCLPLERITPISDNNVSALLRVKVLFISLPLDVNVVTSDVNPDESVNTLVKAKGLGGLIWLNQMFRFALRSLGEKETEVTCQVNYEGMSALLRVSWFAFAPMIKGIATDTFDKLEKRLAQWA